jgi:hypothetical protein
MPVTMKLYRSPDHPGEWIGTDAAGALVRWPAERGGWAKRTPHTGGKRALEEVEPALARGSGWPGAGRAPKRRDPAGKPTNTSIGVKATTEERDAWTQRAQDEGKSISGWARDTLNAEVARPLRPRNKP